MTNKEAIVILENLKIQGKTFFSQRLALDLAIKALKHEVYWEDVKQALNDWLNNISSPQTALNDIYRAYMGKEEENE